MASHKRKIAESNKGHIWRRKNKTRAKMTKKKCGNDSF